LSGIGAKVTSKGQVTIPAAIRNALNIEEGDQLIFETAGEYEVRVKVIKNKPLTSLLGALRKEQGAAEMKDIRQQAYYAKARQRYGEG